MLTTAYKHNRDEEPMDGEPSFDASRAKSLDLGSAACM